MSEGRIFFIIGPTAAGKTVIINEVLKKRADTVRAVSHTTRTKREGEIESADYFFRTRDDFLRLKAENKFIEHSNVYGEMYGTSEDSFNAIKKGMDVVKIIDYQGAEKFKERGIDAIYLFFAPENIEVLKERLKKRGDTDIKERIKVYESEIKFREKCHHFVDTSGITEEDIEKCVDEVIKIMDIYRKGD